MLDNSAQVERLLASMRASLPLAAGIPPGLAGFLSMEAGVVHVPATARITRVDYAGDEGGIMCKFEFDPDLGQAFYVSLTHLRFAARSPLAREIAAYQKRRNKRLRRLVPPSFALGRT